MNPEALIPFFVKLTKSPELRAEFLQLAARHGVALSDSELTTEQLDKITGGLKSTIAARRDNSRDGAAQNIK